ncbi:hypothetical protein [Bradyrhizobium ivorense]|uniref:hypothetical protein n=1 Tax=Bradyrhizobium ivorense TaxID=2511166 RepID=UPI00155B1311|nr:hypothetical protein [Bradyrhizobium ivorense]
MQTRDCQSRIDRQGIEQRIERHTTFLNAASRDRNPLWGLHAGSEKSIVLMERIQAADRCRAAAPLAVVDAGVYCAQSCDRVGGLLIKRASRITPKAFSGSPHEFGIEYVRGDRIDVGQ